MATNRQDKMWVALVGMALLLLLPKTVKAQVTTCLDRLQAHAATHDVLQADDFVDLVYDLSNVRLDMTSPTRTAIHEAFDVRVDPDLQGMALTQSAGAKTNTALAQFCETIYQSLFPFFVPAMSPTTCHAAVTIATSFDGHIHSNGEFLGLVLALSSSGALKAASFDDLKPATRQVFTDFSNSNGVIPESIFQQDESMETFFCRRVILGTQLDDPSFRPRISGTVQSISVLATPAPSPQWFLVSDLQQEQEDITQAEYRQCTLGLLLVDAERDDQLNQAEFVAFLNRFTGNAFAGVNFADLPPIFRNLFTSGTGDGETIPTEGARPGSAADEDQLQFLQNFCIDTYFAVSQWQVPETNIPTASPSLPPLPGDSTSRPTLSPVTLGPTLSEGEFFLCTVNLHLSDTNGDDNDKLSQAEYVGYLNRQLNNVYKTTSYSNIDVIFRENYESLVGDDGTIDISGSEPGGSPTSAERQALRKICSETDRVITIFQESTRTPTAAPNPGTPGGPTSVPTTTPTQITQLQECFLLLQDADTDENSFLTEAEYAAFVASVGKDVFSGSFDQLDPALQEPFDSSKGVVGVIFLIGVRPGEDPTDAQAQFLETFCATVYDAVDLFLNPPQPTGAPEPTPAPGPTVEPEPTTASPTSVTDDPVLRICLIRLDQIDRNSNGLLDELEYISLANDLADDIANNPNAFQFPLAQQPYILRENYAWIAEGAEGAENVDISGADRVGLLNVGELARFGRLCSRTNSTVASVLTGNDQIGLIDHCYASFTAGDLDGNNILIESEFGLTVDYFLGLVDSPGGFDGLDEAFRDYFEDNKGSFGGINVDGSKPTETPTAGQRLLLDYLCVEMQSAAGRAREASSLTSRCQDAMGRANTIRDNTLTNDEYAGFAFYLAGRDTGGGTFTELPGDLQSNYNALRGTQLALDVSGWNGEAVSFEQREKLDFICSSTSALLGLLPTVAPTLSPTDVVAGPSTVTIYNGFIVGNEAGIEASELRNADISDLEDAYTAFVNATVNQKLGIRRLRGRKLVLLGVSPDSIDIYRISDGACPESYQGDDTRCQDVYASFELLVSDEEGNDEIEEQYTAATQQGITNGDLKAQLDATSPDSRLEILGATLSNRPGGNGPMNTPAPTAAPDENNSRGADDDDDGGSNIAIIIGIVGGVIILCCIGGCCIFFCMSRSSSRKPTKDVGIEQPPTRHVGGLPQEAASSEGESIYDEIVPEPDVRGGTLLPSSDHSNEVNFGFSGQSDQRHASSYSGYGKTSLETVPDDDEDESERFEDEGVQYDDGGEYEEEELAGSQSSGWTSETNPWRAGGQPDGALGSAHDDSEGSEELVEKVSPYRGVREPMNMSRSNLSATGLSRTGSGLGGDGLNRSGSVLNKSGSSLERTGSVTSGISYVEQSMQEAGYDDSGEVSYVEEEVVEESEGGSYEEEEVFEEEPQDQGNFDETASSNSQSQFEEDPQFEESYSEASFLSGGSDDQKTQLAFRDEIEALVKQVVPDEIENIDAMIDQFVGREQELIATLRNMADQGAHITESSDEEVDEEEDEESYEDATSYEDGTSYADEDEDGESEYDEEETEGGESEYDEEEEGEEGESEYEDDDEEEGQSQYEDEEGESEYDESSYEEEIEKEEVKKPAPGKPKPKFGLAADDDSSSDSSDDS
eukprot:scaffold32086_cov183-Amphora_coffeaeformis.AAC.5